MKPLAWAAACGGECHETQAEGGDGVETGGGQRDTAQRKRPGEPDGQTQQGTGDQFVEQIR